MAFLIDTNFLVAAASPKDAHHLIARQSMRNLTDKRIVPAPVLPEMFYLLTERVNYATAFAMFKTIHSGAFQIEALTDSDMARMQEIMIDYADNEFDFTDVAIMALAERLLITEVYTFDQRDFNAFRPKHRPYLRLLP